MKTAIIMSYGIKQVMFTPENEEEKLALKMITPNDNINIEVKTGTFYTKSPECARGYTVQKCKGDYLRAFEDEDSLMLVLTPKEAESD